jgi:WD40 repeat protein
VEITWVRNLAEKTEAPPKAKDTAPAPSTALDSLRREQIPAAALTTAGNGDPNKAPSCLVGVLGEAEPIHTGRVNSLAFSPDGTWLASASYDRTIHLRAVSTGQVQRILKGHTGAVMAVGFSKDSRTLVSASLDGTLRLWPLDGTSEPEVLRPNLGEIGSMAVSADGRFVAAGGARGAGKLWKWGQWQQALDLPAHPGKITTLAFDPDGALLASGCEEAGKPCAIRLFKTADGKRTQELPCHPRRLVAVAFSRDGKYLASVGDEKAKVHDLGSGKIMFDVGQFREHADAVIFSADSKKIVICNGDRQGVLFDLASQKQEQTLAGEWGNLRAAALSPDGKLLALGGDSGIVLVWDSTTWKQKYLERGHRHHVLALAVAPDGRTLISAGDDNTVRRWNLAPPYAQQVVKEFEEPVAFVRYSPDGKMFVTASGLYGWMGHLLTSWDATTLKERTVQERADIRVPRPSGMPVHLTSLAVSPDGKTIAGCGRAQDAYGSGVHLWDAALGKFVHRFPAVGWSLALAFSADGKLLATATAERKLVKVWDVARGTEVHSWKDTSMTAVGFPPDGKGLATGHADGSIKLRDLADGKKQQTLSGHTAQVQALRFSPDGKTLVSCGLDGTIRVWGPPWERAQHVISLGLPSARLVMDLDSSGQYVFAAGAGPLIYVLRLPREGNQVVREKSDPASSHAAWLAGVARLPLPDVPDAVAKRLGELNPGFDGKMDYSRGESQQLVRLAFSALNVKDISPVQALPGLQSLDCTGTWETRNSDMRLADLAPLRGLSLTNLACNNTKVANLAPLQGMPLKQLSIFGTPVAELAPLRGMPLEALNCCWTQVADLSPLQDMPLHSLNFHATKVTAAGLAPLEKMTSLRYVCLGGAAMTDDALPLLKKLPELEVLSFLDTPISEAAFRNVQVMTKLQALHLRNSGLPDEALVHLKDLPHLRGLSLEGVPLGKVGREHLAGFKNLVELNVQRTGLTDEDLARLKTALPRCKIWN